MAEHHKLVLHELVIRREGETHIVGRVTSGVFVRLPPVGVAAIKLIQQGLPLSEVQANLPEVDIPAFATDLLDCGFVTEADGRRIDEDQQPPHLPRLQAHHVRWLFTWPAATVWLATVAAAAVTLIRHPELLPTNADFFWLPGTSLPLVTGTAIACVTITAHELAHLAAARAINVPARISISTRLHHIVAQTDVSGAWAAQRRQRQMVYLAGIAMDLLIAATAVLLMATTTTLDAFLAVVVLTVTLSVAWQFEVYLRTDLYFVLQDQLHCDNLHEDARRYLRGKGARNRRVRWYAWFMATGTVVALTAFAVNTVPILLRLWTQAATAVWQGPTLPMLDGAATLLHQALLVAVFVTGFRRSRAKRRADRVGQRTDGSGGETR